MTTEAELFDTLKYRIDISPLTGTRRYYNTAQLLHREDGPAIVYPYGRHEWYRNGLRHRDVGPAIETAYGHREWWQNGKLHCGNGPAIERYNGHTEWWLNGTPYTEQNYYAQLKVLGCIP